MKKKITQIADVNYGTYAKASKKGKIKYLNASHFDDDYQLNLFSDSYIDATEKVKRFTLKENDVLFAAKGNRNFAWTYKNKHGQCVPSSLFYIIRSNQKQLLGDYLSYLLNSKKIQFDIQNMATGTGMRSIPKKEFLELEIEVPSIEKQKEIIQLAETMDEDIQLTAQLLEMKKELKIGVINKMITED